jgi:hypothetical protein
MHKYNKSSLSIIRSNMLITPVHNCETTNQGIRLGSMLAIDLYN